MGDADETRAHNAEALLEDSLAATLDILRELKDSPIVRDLRTRAETYRRTIERWENVRPSHEQRGALRELVLQLHARALDLADGAAAPGSPSREE
jgi:glutamyl-tRNA reductase